MSFGMIVWSLICMGAGSALTLFVQKVLGRSKTARGFADEIKEWADGEK